MLRIEVTKRIKSAIGKDQLKIDISVRTDAITAVFGNSGEGKSTLFNMIAGFVTPERGSIRFEEELWFSEAEQINRKTQDRKIAYVFQENNLFPHFTVGQNIEYALPKDGKVSLKLEELLQELGVEKLQDSYPHQLSGGQSQRVAIARALAQEARIILMDEPFAALDLELKIKLYRLLRNFQQQYSLCILLISHDLQDIAQVCDEVVWIEQHEAGQVLKKTDFQTRIAQKISKL